MRHALPSLAVSLAVLVLAACNSDPSGGDAGSCTPSAGCAPGFVCRDGQCEAEPDAGGPDAGPPDAGPSDAGAPDAGPADAGPPDAGPLTCAAGTADCDSNPADCETNIATDALNCGRCARACGGTATCSAGLCSATLLMDPDVSSNFCGAAFTADRMFTITCWGNNDLSEVRTAPLTPGADLRGTSVVAYNNVPVMAMRGMLIDGDSVYFGLEGNPSHVYRYPVSGSGAVTVAFTTDAGTRFDALQLVGDTYYWSDNSHTVPGTVAPGLIKRRAKTDTADTTLVSGVGLTYDLVVTDTKLLWLDYRSSPGDLRLYQAPRDGTGGDPAKVKEVAPTVPGAYMVRAGPHVYWTHKAASPNGKLRRFEFGNEAAVAEDVATNLNLPEGLVTDGAYLYFKQLDSLYRVPLAGGTPERLSPTVAAHDSQATQLFHVDDRYVYFPAGPTAGDSKVYRVAK